MIHRACERRVFGSRARGDFRRNSDFDIAVIGRKCSNRTWATMMLEINEDPITLFAVDVVEYETASPSLKKMILSEGISLYA